jgi:hypothetical protein
MVANVHRQLPIANINTSIHFYITDGRISFDGVSVLLNVVFSIVGTM